MANTDTANIYIWEILARYLYTAGLSPEHVLPVKERTLQGLEQQLYLRWGVPAHKALWLYLQYSSSRLQPVAALRSQLHYQYLNGIDEVFGTAMPISILARLAWFAGLPSDIFVRACKQDPFFTAPKQLLMPAVKWSGLDLHAAKMCLLELDARLRYRHEKTWPAVVVPVTATQLDVLHFQVRWGISAHTALHPYLLLRSEQQRYGHKPNAALEQYRSGNEPQEILAKLAWTVGMPLDQYAKLVKKEINHVVRSRTVSQVGENSRTAGSTDTGTHCSSQRVYQGAPEALAGAESGTPLWGVA